MNFSQRQADPRRHLAGITVVILFHLFIVYALVTGLAKKVVDVVRAPIETKVIDEVKKPPPPEVVLPPPPKLEAPPPPYIPPPEVQVATPPPPTPTITAAASPVPPAPVEITPQAPVAAVAPASAKPAVVAIGVVCPNQPQPKMPSRALREGIAGSVKAVATIKGGRVTAIEIVSATPRGVFDAAVRNAMMQYDCRAAGDEEVRAVQDFDFKLE
ncbi:MAG: energy transducer TonB [Pseudomonadota bacterium]|nr:energy transducer TonB [Pseudomonadota bacterium]